MKRILYLTAIMIMLLSGAVSFTAQNEPQTTQPPQSGGAQPQQEQFDRPIKNSFGEISEIALASEVHAFLPKNYSVVYIRPFGEGLVDEISIVTYRPRMIAYQGTLTERGVKFTTIFPTMHFVYITSHGTGSKVQLLYKPSAGTENMNQTERVKLAFDYANAQDEQYERQMQQLEERNRRNAQERDRQFSEQLRQQQQENQNRQQPQ